MCKNLGYNSTMMPNRMGHDNQINADLGVITNLLSPIIPAYVIFMVLCYRDPFYMIVL